MVCNDIAHETWPAAWRAQAAARGYRGGALLPLRLAGETIGALTLYADEPALFDAEEVKLLDELAADVSLGLEYIEKDNELHQLSYYDPLTDLPNRTLFSDRLHQALSRAQYRDRHVAVLMLPVERFKEINSLRPPHRRCAAADVAQRLKALLRPRRYRRRILAAPPLGIPACGRGRDIRHRHGRKPDGPHLAGAA